MVMVAEHVAAGEADEDKVAVVDKGRVTVLRGAAMLREAGAVSEPEEVNNPVEVPKGVAGEGEEALLRLLHPVVEEAAHDETSAQL